MMARKGENIYKRKDGRWEGRYPVGKNARGRAKYRSIYGKTYAEVREKLLPLKANSCQYQESGRRTVGALLEEWLAAVQLRVKPSTHASYRMKADKHILPEFGEIRYDKLTVPMLHAFIARKLESGLSAKYVSDIVVVIKSVAKYASRVHGFRNPVQEVILPKIPRTERKILSPKEQKMLCRHLQKHENSTSLCILLSLYTGLRVGEVCGLRWGDIDFAKSRFTVRRTVQRIRCEGGTRILVDSPKSRTSVRTIPLPAFLMPFLRKLRGKDDAYVLSGSIRVMEPRTLQHRFKAVLRKAGLPSVGFHSLRHAFATNCVALGFDVKTLSEILGHASVETTLNRYVHSSMERKTECMGLLKPAA